VLSLIFFGILINSQSIWHLFLKLHNLGINDWSIATEIYFFEMLHNKSSSNQSTMLFLKNVTINSIHAIHLFIYLSVCLPDCLSACLSACVCLSVCVYVCLHVSMYACMYVCVHACMYVCICFYVMKWMHPEVIGCYLHHTHTYIATAPHCAADAICH
jgi:hypothetical protein